MFEYKRVSANGWYEVTTENATFKIHGKKKVEWYQAQYELQRNQATQIEQLEQQTLTANQKIIDQQAEIAALKAQLEARSEQVNDQDVLTSEIVDMADLEEEYIDDEFYFTSDITMQLFNAASELYCFFMQLNAQQFENEEKEELTTNTLVPAKVTYKLISGLKYLAEVAEVAKQANTTLPCLN